MKLYNFLSFSGKYASMQPESPNKTIDSGSCISLNSATLPFGYACPNNCGRIYKYKGNMMLHYKQECGKEPAYVCKFCMKKFTKKGNLKTHLGLIHNSLDL